MTKCSNCILMLCLMAPSMRPQTAPPETDITGKWDGIIAGKLRVILHIEKNSGGALHAVLEVPSQNGAKIPTGDVSFDGKRAFHFEWKSIGAIYDGDFRSAGPELAGTWQQSGGRLPLTLKRAGSTASTAALEPVKRGSITLQPCLASDQASQALCGSYDVYENRASRSGRKISLNLMILPALAEHAAPDPVFGFAGGPGQSATENLPFVSFLRRLQQHRDVVLIDQRGTGKSNPLRCPFDPQDVKSMLEHPDALDRLAACRAELKKRADFTQYTTSNSSADFDEVRQALGYDKINVFGGSYGALAALDYLRHSPAHVRAIAIESVVPPDYRLPLPFAKSVQSALLHVFADCAADPACSKDFPHLKDEFENIVKRLDRAPARFDFKSGGSEAKQIVLSRGAFVSSLRAMLYQPAIISQFPYLIHRAYEGDWSAFAAADVLMSRALGDQIARGMSYSVICAESLPFITEREIRRETGHTYLGDFDIRLYQKRCALWPHAEVSKDFIAPVRSDVPALLIAGAEDPATPPSTAHEAAETLSHSRVVAVPHGTHLTGAACIDDIITRFIESGSESGIDTRCVDQIRNPPFITMEQVTQARSRAAN